MSRLAALDKIFDRTLRFLSINDVSLTLSRTTHFVTQRFERCKFSPITECEYPSLAKLDIINFTHFQIISNINYRQPNHAEEYSASDIHNVGYYWAAPAA